MIFLLCMWMLLSRMLSRLRWPPASSCATSAPSSNFSLGMSITRDRKQRKLTVSSTAHIDAMLQRYNMADARPAPTPLEHMACLRARTDSEERLHLSVPYRGAVGFLLYVAMWTAPTLRLLCRRWLAFKPIRLCITGNA
jgi:hypothetical protein